MVRIMTLKKDDREYYLEYTKPIESCTSGLWLYNKDMEGIRLDTQEGHGKRDLFNLLEKFFEEHF